MSEGMKSNVALISMAIGILVGVVGFIGAWAIIPYRLEAAEKAIHMLQVQSKSDREILIRIEERQIEFNRKLERLVK